MRSLYIGLEEVVVEILKEIRLSVNFGMNESLFVH